MWHWIVARWTDIAIAFILAIIFAVLADVMSIGSRIRTPIRQYLNHRSERSAARLSKRIGELEERRKMLSSQTGVVILAVQSILGTLCFLTLAGLSIAARETDSSLMLWPWTQAQLPGMARAGYLNFSLLAFIAFLGALATAVAGMRLAGVDREERFMKAVAQLDKEITGLRTKLEQKTQATPSTNPT